MNVFPWHCLSKTVAPKSGCFRVPWGVKKYCCLGLLPRYSDLICELFCIGTISRNCAIKGFITFIFGCQISLQKSCHSFTSLLVEHEVPSFSSTVGITIFVKNQRKNVAFVYSFVVVWVLDKVEYIFALAMRFHFFPWNVLFTVTRTFGGWC